LVSPMASFPQASPPTPCAPLYPHPYAPHALPIRIENENFDFIFEQEILRSVYPSAAPHKETCGD